jgi:sulfate transport system substrate-binding protein
VKPGVEVIIPNPKTSGNGRYSYLAAWGFALQAGGGKEAAARDFVGTLFKNVPVLDTGGRGATTTFAQRGIGDVLLTFENEAVLTVKELGGEKLDVVMPPASILAEAPVAVVDKVVEKKGHAEAGGGVSEFPLLTGRAGAGGEASFPANYARGAGAACGDLSADQALHRGSNRRRMGCRAEDAFR